MSTNTLSDMDLLSKQACFLNHYSYQFIGNESTALLKAIYMLNIGKIPMPYPWRLQLGSGAAVYKVNETGRSSKNCTDL